MTSILHKLAHAYLDAQIESALTPGATPGDTTLAGVRAVLLSLRDQAGDPEVVEAILKRADERGHQVARGYFDEEDAETALTAALDHILSEKAA